MVNEKEMENRKGRGRKVLNNQHEQVVFGVSDETDSAVK